MKYILFGIRPSFTRVIPRTLAIAFILFASGLFVVPAAQADTAVLGVTQISAVQTFATADGTFANGWKWIFDVTVPSNETNVQMKFADWTSALGTIPAGSNTQFFSAQSSNAADEAHAIPITAANTYSASMSLLPNADLDLTKGGNQIQILVETRVPAGSAGGSYSTSYGIQSNPAATTTPDTTMPVITLLGIPTVTIQTGTTYIDAGATALDNIDGNITTRITVTGSVNTAVAGSYVLTYNVSDSAGNAATPVIRTVNVVTNSGGGGSGSATSTSTFITLSSLSATSLSGVTLNAGSNGMTPDQRIYLTVNDPVWPYNPLDICGVWLPFEGDASFIGRTLADIYGHNTTPGSLCSTTGTFQLKTLNASQDSTSESQQVVISATGTGINTTALSAAINSAQTLVNGAVEGTAPGMYTVGSKAILQTAISAATAVMSNAASTQTAIDSSVTTLNTAVATFVAGLVPTSGGSGGGAPTSTASPTLSALSATSLSGITLTGGFANMSPSQRIYLTVNDPQVWPYDVRDICGLWLPFEGDGSFVGKTLADIYGHITTPGSFCSTTGTFQVKTLNGSQSVTIDSKQVVISATGTSTNTTALSAAITSAQTLFNGAVEGTAVGQYAAGSKAILQTAINAATAVKNNTSATQANVDAAVTALNTAVTTFQAGIVAAANTATLSATINSAQTLVNGAVEGTAPGMYAVGSKAILQTAINSAMSVLNSSPTSQSAVDNAVATLNTAVATFTAGLVPAGGGSSGSGVTSTASPTLSALSATSLAGITLTGGFTSMSPSQRIYLTVNDPQVWPYDVRDICGLWLPFEGDGNFTGKTLANIYGHITSPGSFCSTTGTFQVKTLNGSQSVTVDSKQVVISATIANTAALSAAITSAQTLFNGAVEGTAVGQYAAGSKAILQTTINVATAVMNNTASTQANVDSAVTTLNTAVATFTAGQVQAGGGSQGGTTARPTLSALSATSLAGITLTGGFTSMSPSQRIYLTVNDPTFGYPAADVCGIWLPFEGDGNFVGKTLADIYGHITSPGSLCSTTGTFQVKTVNANQNGTLDSQQVVISGTGSGANTTALSAAITSAQTLFNGAVEGTAPGMYAVGSKAILQTAINTATAVKNNTSATQANVDAAVTALNTAVATFQGGIVPAANTTALSSAITSAQNLFNTAVEGTAPGQFAVGSKAILQTAINAATAVKNNAASTQVSVDAAVTTLNNAITTFQAGIVAAANTAALSAAITSAQTLFNGAVEGTAVGQYAAGSKAILQTAINAATAVKNNTSATQAVVDAAVTTLNNAVTTFQAGKVVAVSTSVVKFSALSATSLAGITLTGGFTSMSPSQRIYLTVNDPTFGYPAADVCGIWLPFEGDGNFVGKTLADIYGHITSPGSLCSTTGTFQVKTLNATQTGTFDSQTIVINPSQQ